MEVQPELMSFNLRTVLTISQGQGFVKVKSSNRDDDWHRKQFVAVTAVAPALVVAAGQPGSVSLGHLKLGTEGVAVHVARALWDPPDRGHQRVPQTPTAIQNFRFQHKTH